jgi:hypothetical protein
VLAEVITLMRMPKTWGQFKHMLDLAHPKRGDTLQLPLMADMPMPPEEEKPTAQGKLLWCSARRDRAISRCHGDANELQTKDNLTQSSHRR